MRLMSADILPELSGLNVHVRGQCDLSQMHTPDLVSPSLSPEQTSENYDMVRYCVDCGFLFGLHYSKLGQLCASQPATTRS